MEFLGSVCSLVFLVSIVTSIVFGIKKIRGKDVGKKFKISNITIAVSFVLAFIFIGFSPTNNDSADKATNSEAKTEKVASKKKTKKFSIKLLNSGKHYEVTGEGGKNKKLTFNLKGKSNKSATITISGVPDGIWGGKDIKQKIQKGNFTIALPIYANEKSEKITLKVEAKDSSNYRIVKHIDIKNSTQAFAKYKESVKLASSKAESESKAKESSKAESESRAIAENQSRAESESTASSIAVSQSEAAAASSKAAASTAASQNRSNANVARSTQNSTTNTAGNDVATGEKIIGDSRSHIYHMPGQATYHLNPANAVYFNSEAEAQAAGYRRSKR